MKDGGFAESTTRAAAAERLASLDSLRGAAILAVLCSHFLGVLHFGQEIDDAIVDLGRGGVTLFFLLSGYLIFRNVQVQPLGTFLCRRFFKVMPAYWLNIAIILVADLSLAGAAHFSARSYLASTFAVSDLLGVEAVSGVFWTLLIEIKFYAFIAIQYAVFGRRHLHLVFALLLLFEMAVWAHRGHGSLTLSYFPVFYLGIEISLAEAEGWSSRAVLRLTAVALLLAGSLYLCLDQHQLGAAACLLAGAGVFVVALRAGISNRLAGFMGVTSYSNYLYHSIIAGSLFAMFGAGRGTGAFLPALVAVFIATTVAATLSYRLVEVPMVNLGRRLTARPAP